MAPNALNSVIECGRHKEYTGVSLSLIRIKPATSTYKNALHDLAQLPCHNYFPVEALLLDLFQLQPSRIIIADATPSGTAIFQMISPYHPSSDHFLQALFIGDLSMFLEHMGPGPDHGLEDAKIGAKATVEFWTRGRRSGG